MLKQYQTKIEYNTRYKSTNIKVLTRGKDWKKKAVMCDRL